MSGQPLYVAIHTPREGMKGTFDHLYATWGLPHFWPEAVRAIVCESKHVPLRAGVSLNLLTGEER
jgi:hypothetical protein